MRKNENAIAPAKFILLAIILLASCTALLAQGKDGLALGGPTMGNYTNRNVLIGSNSTFSPTAAPSGAVRTTAQASSGFKGVLTVNPGSGVVRVTNAMPEGTFTITLTGTDSGGSTTTRSFQLTVQRVPAGCSPYTSASFVRASASPFPTGSEPTYPAIADFNNDGHQDIAIANFSGNNVAVLLGIGNGNFGPATIFGTGTSPEYIATDDFNGDGNADFIVGNVNSGNVNVYLGDGSGGFTQAPGSPIATGSFVRFVVTGDFDNNGTADFATANEMSNNVTVFSGNGIGGFSLLATLSTGGGRPSGLVKGDFNGDTHIDLAAQTFNNSVIVFNGNSAGVFTTGPTTAIGGFPNFLVSGDINDDGILDLLTDNDSGNDGNVLTGLGTGSFTLSGVSFGIRTFGLSAADLDGDGDDDILATPSFSSNVSLRISNGDGTFTNAGNITGFDTATGHAIGDFNGDNRLDFAVAEFNRFSSVLGCTYFIVNTSLPTGRRGEAYNQQINVQGGTPNFTYSATGLPNGLTIGETTGLISGTPTQTGAFSVTVTVTDSTPTLAPEGAEAAPSARLTSKVFPMNVFVPTAADVSVSGRAVTSDGRGIRNAVVSITLPNGTVRTAATGSLGYYLIEGLPAGQTYTLAISGKRYTFTNPTRIITISDDLTGIDFVSPQ